MKTSKILNYAFARISAVILLSIITVSCQDDDNDTTSSTTHFAIEGTDYQATETKENKTEFGNIISASGADFELRFILSDNESTGFDIVDTLRGTDTGKGRAILKFNDQYHFATSGMVEYDQGLQSGTFSLAFDNLQLQEGVINVEVSDEQPLLDFTKLRQTDPQGNPMTLDTADWTARTTWQPAERFVFNLDEVQTPYADIDIVTFPNPMNEYVSVYTDNPQQDTFDLFIVNENLEVEASFMNLSDENVMLNLDDPRFKGNYYRFYYRIHANAETYYGSGDVKMDVE